VIKDEINQSMYRYKGPQAAQQSNRSMGGSIAAEGSTQGLQNVEIDQTVLLE